MYGGRDCSLLVTIRTDGCTCLKSSKYSGSDVCPIMFHQENQESDILYLGCNRRILKIQKDLECNRGQFSGWVGGGGGVKYH